MSKQMKTINDLTPSQQRLYAVACARRVQHLITDPRSLTALDVAERYANGQATDEELAAARVAAAYEAAMAAWNAARTAVEEAWVAAGAAASSAAYAASEAGGDYDEAYRAERETQKQLLQEMFPEEQDTTRDDILRMAREAGFVMVGDLRGAGSLPRLLERFAALVAAAEREAVVRKCAGIVADAVDHREPASTYASKIKKHFGVE